MREDPRVALTIVFVCLPVVLGAVDALEAYWGARDDPTWETRWRSLDPAESSWLAVVATSRNWMATLTDPEEIRLAKGCRRRESRRRVNFDLAAMPLFLAVAALALTGVLSQSILLSLFLAFGLVRNSLIYRRERQIKGALEAQRKLAVATTA